MDNPENLGVGRTGENEGQGSGYLPSHPWETAGGSLATWQTHGQDCEMNNVLNEPKKHIRSARAGPWVVTLGSSPVALAHGPGRGFLMAPTPGAQPGSGAWPNTSTGLAHPSPVDPRHHSSGQR